MAIKGYVVFVPGENVASMEYGAPGDDKATVATTPGHLAGPFEVVMTVSDKPVIQPCGPVANEVRRHLAAMLAEVPGPADAGWCQEKTWDGPYAMTCGRKIVNGACGLHGKRAG